MTRLYAIYIYSTLITHILHTHVIHHIILHPHPYITHMQHYTSQCIHYTIHYTIHYAYIHAILYMPYYTYHIIHTYTPITQANCVHVPNVPLNVGGAISPKYTGTTTDDNPDAKPIIYIIIISI